MSTKDIKPEDLQKDLEEVFNKKYGSGIQVITPMWGPDSSKQETDDHRSEKIKFDLDFNYKPKDLKNYLDRFVVKQDDAKKALAIAICDHYNHVRECHNNPHNIDPYYSKQNILITGPTGVGKTYLVKLIAELIGVPFVKADATRFSETGYIGANVDDLIRDLVTKADGDIELAQYGIIYLDEADKLAAKSHSSGRDVSGRGVQVGLLKLMEETEVDLRASNDMQSQIQALMEFQRKGRVDKKIVNTRNIVFIVSGAFSGLDKIIRDRLHRKTIGIRADIKTSIEEEQEDIFSQATTSDFIEFGFEPEFVGRLPVRVSCQNLTVEDLFQILTESEGSIIKQYKSSLKAYGIEVIFSEDGLRQIAEFAHKEKTGARALLTVCEKTLRDFKFELPSTQVKEFVVTREVVLNPSEVLQKLILDPSYHRHLVLAAHIHFYEKSFYSRHALQIRFDEETQQLLCDKAIAEQKTISSICDELLKSYEYGLSIVKQNTSNNLFILSKEIVKDPQALLEKLIRDSYQKKNPNEKN